MTIFPLHFFWFFKRAVVHRCFSVLHLVGLFGYGSSHLLQRTRYHFNMEHFAYHFFLSFSVFFLFPGYWTGILTSPPTLALNLSFLNFSFSLFSPHINSNNCSQCTIFNFLWSVGDHTINCHTKGKTTPLLLNTWTIAN